MLLHPIFNHCAIFPLPKVWRKADQDGRQIDKSGKSSNVQLQDEDTQSHHFKGLEVKVVWIVDMSPLYLCTLQTFWPLMSSLLGNYLGSLDRLEWSLADSVWQGFACTVGNKVCHLMRKNRDQCIVLALPRSNTEMLWDKWGKSAARRLVAKRWRVYLTLEEGSG